MEDTYKSLEKPAEGVFRDRNSKFLAFGFPVDHIEQVNDLLNSLRKKYHDARHHCYAYRIGTEKETYRLNDDGEPSGTAGKPIYNQLLSHDLINILVVVVRYFGGTLLGTGGLINAYRSATNDMLDKASIVNRVIEEQFQLNFPYEKLSTVMKVLKEENLVPLNPLYESQCQMNIAVRKSLSGRFTQKIYVIKGITIRSL